MRVVEASAFCAACFQAKPGEPHVDMGAAYDGPVIRQEDGAPQTIDDLIVCEGCIRTAARLLALRENPIEVVAAERDAALKDAADWRHYAEKLEGLQAERPEPVKRGRGRPPKRPETTEVVT